ncbi:hypothetical protein K493DRAFT_387803, partial [Basidiobolus meristosporus CBS 931.73]
SAFAPPPVSQYCFSFLYPERANPTKAFSDRYIALDFPLLRSRAESWLLSTIMRASLFKSKQKSSEGNSLHSYPLDGEKQPRLKLRKSVGKIFRKIFNRTKPEEGPAASEQCQCAACTGQPELNNFVLDSLEFEDAKGTLKQMENFEEILSNGFLIEEAWEPTLRFSLTPRVLRA